MSRTTPEPADAAGTLSALDEQQARDRAEVHSHASRLWWHVVRTPRGQHVVLSGVKRETFGGGYQIVASYYNGLEVTRG